jgi:PHS family inorganic phosphate transporter-like MFS transporter
MMAAVFSMQGAGQLAAVLVATIVTFGFRDSLSIPSFSACGPQCQVAADCGWRIIIGISALPAIFALYYRLTIPETPRYTFDVAQDIEKATADLRAFKNGRAEGHPDALQRVQTKLVASNSLIQPRASLTDFCSYFGTWKNGSLLFATTTSWFLVDLVFYGLGLNINIMLAAAGYGVAKDTVYHDLFNTAVGNLIIVCAGSLPGYWLSVAFIDKTGRRPLQVGGFTILTILFCIIGFAYKSLSQGAFLTLYILVQLFFNFGPNTTTFIVPGECFPTRYRSTGHGLSAAGGKIGATVAQIMALTLANKDAPPNCNAKECYPWVPHLMEIFACFMLCGALISLLIPETKRRTLEELAGEKQLTKTNGSGHTSSGSRKTYSSPILRQMQSPHPSATANSEGGGRNGHGRTSSGKLGRGSSERSLRHAGSTLSDDYPNRNGTSRSGNGGFASHGEGPYGIESIQLQDLSGLMLK